MGALKRCGRVLLLWIDQRLAIEPSNYERRHAELARELENTGEGSENTGEGPGK